MPVQSVIVSPVAHAPLDPGEDVTLHGFAWSGGGRGITRVECSADDGRSWHTATLTQVAPAWGGLRGRVRVRLWLRDEDEDQRTMAVARTGLP